MKTIKDKWICIVCGSSYNDLDEINNKLEDHIKNCHKLNLSQYRDLKKNGIGCSRLRVRLLNYPNDIKLALISFLSQTWGPTFDLNNYSSDEISSMIDLALSGKTLSTALESINFTFQIDGLSRASSHQLVRVRIGSGFSQKGMSDAYYGDTDYIIPASIVAAGKLDEYRQNVETSINTYNDLFKSGVTYQDARFVLPHSVTTSLVWTVNYLALKNFCSKRLMRNQSWEMNALCQLIKFEIEKIYPELARNLLPLCDYSKKCCSFGNLFESCGKYPLENLHDRYVFCSSQIARNIVFDDENYKNKIMVHNSKVKKTNNHFLLLAQEKNDLKKEFYGKYAKEIFAQLQDINIKKIKNLKNKFKEVLSTFSEIYTVFENIENEHSFGELSQYISNGYLLKYRDNIASISATLLKKEKTEIINDCWSIHQTKNKKYSDGWYYDGLRGVLKDLHRKNQRLKTMYESNQLYSLEESNLYDSLLYVIFLIVGISNNFPFKGGD